MAADLVALPNPFSVCCGCTTAPPADLATAFIALPPKLIAAFNNAPQPIFKV